VTRSDTSRRGRAVVLLGVLALVVVAVVIAARGVIEAHREASRSTGRSPSSLDDALREEIGAESDGDNLWDTGVGDAFGRYLDERIPGSPTRFYEINLFPNYAFASTQDLVDLLGVSHYEWRRGELSVARVGFIHAGGAPPTFAVDQVPWSRLSTLVDEATERLGVDDPNSRYVQIDNGIYGTDGLTIRVYVTGDASRGGFVIADAQARIIRVNAD